MDVELLANSLGRSVDDTVLCVHMVLAQMTAHVSNRKLRRATLSNGQNYSRDIVFRVVYASDFAQLLEDCP